MQAVFSCMRVWLGGGVGVTRRGSGGCGGIVLEILTFQSKDISWSKYCWGQTVMGSRALSYHSQVMEDLLLLCRVGV